MAAKIRLFARFFLLFFSTETQGTQRLTEVFIMLIIEIILKSQFRQTTASTHRRLNNRKWRVR